MNKKHLITIRRLRRIYETAINNNKELCKTIQKTRKQIYRLKVANRKTIDNLNDKIIKIKAREEVMESALRTAYNKTKIQVDKRVLRSTANTVIVKKNKYKSYVAKLLGLRGRIRILQPAQELRRGGSVKRTLDKQVAYSRDITNGKEVFEMLKSISKSIQLFFIEESDIEMVQEHVPISLKPVPGTMQIHQMLCFANSAHLLNRLLNCFCQIDRV
ncbi:hypothetical protein K1T71_011653 [Dendrolimus kikuchii]|uniref:Uncharacterized protein n=1 Tax=Dendrolimus kikuchii TaxID=765133 RepID=A0ACC1CLP1_9NEOP|nr:hypothetical protein K1T71_011653 [Dendrolimus kikuchii]